MVYTDTYRGYRALCCPGKEETAYQVVLEHSDLFIISSTDLRSQILDRLYRVRQQLISYISVHPEFASSLQPVRVYRQAPPVVVDMARAAEVFQVGPMAAVAGAIAQDIADHFQPASQEIIVENGGDIYLHSSRTRTIGLLPHPTEKMTLGLQINAREFPCAVCSSSATIGHSLSLGRGDLVVAKGRTGAMADAAATCMGNLVADRKSLSTLKKKGPELPGTGN